jgi:hypothetical protein
MIFKNAYRKSAIATIFVSGFIVGTLDIVAAIYSSGVGAGRVLKYIAAAVFGVERVVEGGSQMVIWGAFFHYLIAYGWTILYFLLFPYWAKIFRWKLLMALSYGLLIWAIMNLVVLPLSQLPSIPFEFTAALKQAMILVVMIAIPLTFIFARYFQTAVTTRSVA